MSKKIYGLIGFPVKHSLSSYMHNAAFSALGIDAQYELFEVAPQNLNKFFSQTIAERGIYGFNVTIPHKEEVLGFINTKLPEAVELIAAANTIKVDDDKISCCNTDSEGFLLSLDELDFDVKAKKVALLGAGGAAKAVCIKLAQQGAAKISIYDVDKERADNLVKKIKASFQLEGESVDSIEGLEIKSADFF